MGFPIVDEIGRYVSFKLHAASPFPGVSLKGTKACFGLRLQPPEWNGALIAEKMSLRLGLSADLGPNSGICAFWQRLFGSKTLVQTKFQQLFPRKRPYTNSDASFFCI